MKQCLLKLNPDLIIKNPVMFTVELGTAVMLVVTLYTFVKGETSQGNPFYNLAFFAVLLVTVLFANFAEAIAEARGKAQAESLRRTREETPAKKLAASGSEATETVPSSALRKGDLFICEAGDTVPADGEIIEGLATIEDRKRVV